MLQTTPNAYWVSREELSLLHSGFSCSFAAYSGWPVGSGICHLLCLMLEKLTSQKLELPKWLRKQVCLLKARHQDIHFLTRICNLCLFYFSLIDCHTSFGTPPNFSCNKVGQINFLQEEIFRSTLKSVSIILQMISCACNDSGFTFPVRAE